METVISRVENTGKKRVEIFTFRLCVSKSEFWKPGSTWRLSLIEPVTFNQGLLAGIPHTFKLRIPGDFSQVYVDFTPQDPVTKGSRTTRVTGIKLSLLENGFQRHSENMKKESNSAVVTTYTYRCDMNARQWTDSVNELKIDITVVQSTLLQFKVSKVPVSPKLEPVSSSMDFSKYFLSTQLSDASIKCAEETFPVHLLVLAENNPVFAKMFEHDTKEAETRCVEIIDSQPAAVREMLRYFYTRAVNDLDVIGFELYEVADKYLVNDLKAICTNFLTSNVNLENVSKLYCFGHKHGNPMLVDAAKFFLSRTATSTSFNLHDFRKLLDDVPVEYSNEIFRLAWYK